MHELLNVNSTERDMERKYTKAGEHLYMKPGQALKVSNLDRSSAANTQVTFLMGGAGSRLIHVTRDTYSKHMIPVNWQPLSKYTLDLWKNRGFSKFAFLTDNSHRGKSIMEYYGDGKKLGVEIKYSVEAKKMGSGGAFKFAIQNKTIKDSFLYNHPDDMIVHYPNFPEDFLKVFQAAMREGYKILVLCVSGSLYPYGEVVDKDGKVVEYAEKPFIEKDSDTGIWGISKSVFDEILAVKDEEFSIEKTIFKTVAKEGKMCKVIIPPEYWIPVNDDNSLKKFEDTIKSSS
ncbi:MAG: sugar phosphate nucleotidyltransferase [Candidatus Aenigmatarchaeota archaeon]